MKQFLNSSLGRLRLLGFLEGTSLLLLIFIAVPAKHAFGNPDLVKLIGPVHGILFVLFILNTLRVGIDKIGNSKRQPGKFCSPALFRSVHFTLTGLYLEDYKKLTGPVELKLI